VATISGAAGVLVHSLGVTGIGVGVFLNGLGVPGLSEVLLPLGGVGVKTGHIALAHLLIVAMVAQLLGVSVAYYIARYGGVALVEKYGKYVLISSREIKAVDRLFDKHGRWLVLFGAFIPGIQGFIGYVAGLAEMNYVRFLASVFFGKLVWIGGLVYLGSVLGKHIDLIDTYVRQIGLFILVVGVILVVWYVRKHRETAPGKGAKSEN